MVTAWIRIILAQVSANYGYEYQIIPIQAQAEDDSNPEEQTEVIYTNSTSNLTTIIRSS